MLLGCDLGHAPGAPLVLAVAARAFREHACPDAGSFGCAVATPTDGGVVVRWGREDGPLGRITSGRSQKSSRRLARQPLDYVLVAAAATVAPSSSVRADGESETGRHMHGPSCERRRRCPPAPAMEYGTRSSDPTRRVGQARSTWNTRNPLPRERSVGPETPGLTGTRRPESMCSVADGPPRDGADRAAVT
jgi:hypothetical protein